MLPTSLAWIFASLLISSHAMANAASCAAIVSGTTPLHASYLSVDLTDKSGQTFFAVMTAKDGIKSNIDADSVREFVVPNSATIIENAGHFDPVVFGKILRLFRNGESDFVRLVDSLEGKTLNPVSILPALRSSLSSLKILRTGPDGDPKIPLNAQKIAPFFALASGSGVMVRLDANNYYLNQGYPKGNPEDPELLKTQVKKGRSFGASPGRKALDASDPVYLKGLKEYMDANPDATEFYTVMFDILIRSDASGLKNLSEDGQILMTDFIAVYTAEMTRYLMTGDLHQHAWMNDLAEVTMDAAYGTASGMVMREAEFVTGVPNDYFAPSKVSTSSGIGITRRDRQALQKRVSQALRETDQTAAAVEAIIGQRKDGDIIHGVMLFLNDEANQSVISKRGPELRDAVVEFLVSSRVHHAVITPKVKASLEKNPLPKPIARPPFDPSKAKSQSKTFQRFSTNKWSKKSA
jgi:hypothetical protein